MPARCCRRPFEMQALDKGYNKLAAGMDLFGHYMGRSAFARRAWVNQNEATVINFMRALPRRHGISVRSAQTAKSARRSSSRTIRA